MRKQNLGDMKNAVNWFEIPAIDFDRAKRFYESILGKEMFLMEGMGLKSAFFPADLENGGIGGCIIKGEGYVPSKTGSIVYLNGGDNLSDILERVEPSGGRILLPKTDIGENGFMAHFEDTEGNKLGLHSIL